MRIKYVGPNDVVEVAGIELRRNHQTEVPADLAGRPPDPRLYVVMTELRDAITARDHVRAAELRAEIADMDYGEGLLAQETFQAVADKAKKDGAE